MLPCNGALVRLYGTQLIYYATSDSRMHVVSAAGSQMMDYGVNTRQIATLSTDRKNSALLRSNVDLIEQSDWLLSRRMAAHTNRD